MRIDGRDIGRGRPPYIVGEISGEHRGCLENAKRLILALKEAGADAAKLQCFDPDRLAEARGGKDELLTEGLWKGRTLGSLYHETWTPLSWFPGLFAYANEIGITLFSSVFDEDGVDFLETIGCPAYKISAYEKDEFSLIAKAAATRKPVIVSGPPGEYPMPNRAYLYCVSEYPTPIENANLRRMVGGNFDGFSDHTTGIIAAVAAAALGAKIIEKHVTLTRADGGPDAAFSLEPQEFAALVRDVKLAWMARGR